MHYGEAIIDAIHESRIMVLVFSSKANLSGHIPKVIGRAGEPPEEMPEALSF